MTTNKNSLSAKDLQKRGEAINAAALEVKPKIPGYVLDCVIFATERAQNSMDILTNWIIKFPVRTKADRGDVNKILKRVFQFTPTCARITVVTEDHEGTKVTSEETTRDPTKLWTVNGLKEFKIVGDPTLKKQKAEWDLLGLRALVHAQERYDKAAFDGEDLSQFDEIDTFWRDAASTSAKKLVDFNAALAVLKERGPKFIKGQMEKGNIPEGSEETLEALCAVFARKMSEPNWAEEVQKVLEEQERTGTGDDVTE